MKFRTINQVLKYAENYDTANVNIDLSSNHITTVDGLENINCLSLILSYNEIENIPDNWNPICDIVHMDNNKINYIGIGSFSNRYYAYINFSKNNINTINPLWRPTINKLILTSNNITDIPSEIDITCNELGLSFNKIKRLHNFPKIKCHCLDLTKNNITKIPDNFHVNCDIVDLGLNQIKHIPSSFSKTVNNHSPFVLYLDNNTKYYLVDFLVMPKKINNTIKTITI